MTKRNYGFSAPTESDDQDGGARVIAYAAVAGVLWLAAIILVAVVI